MEIKKEMNAELARTSPEKLQRIVLSKEEFEDAKEGDIEVEWYGNMYDIATIKIDGDKVEILALRDEWETSLLSFTKILVDTSSHDSKQPSNSLTQFYSLNFLVSPIHLTNDLLDYSLISHSTPYNFLRFTNHIKGLFRPPKID